MCNLYFYVNSFSQDDDEILCKLPEETITGMTSPPQVSFKLLDLLENGTSKLFSPDKETPQDVILIMGNTGCGKTTLTKMIAGDLTKLQAKESKIGNLIVIDDERQISSSTISKTAVPELVLSRDGNLAIFDCPGFDDNRGSIIDIAANYFVNQIFSKVSRVKLLFLAHHNSVKLGNNDRSGFDTLAKHATTLLKNIQTFNQSVGLVVTNVQTESGHRRRPKSEQEILTSVVEFLQQYRKDTLQKSQREDRIEAHRHHDIKKIQFVDILLQATNNEYKQISLSVGPKYCGPLSKSDTVKATRVRVLGLIENLSYGPVGDPAINFGFSLKDSTKDEVKSSYTTELNDAISGTIRKEMNDVVDWYSTVSNWTNLSSKVLLTLSNETRIAWKNLNNLNVSNQEDPVSISTEIINWVSSMGYTNYEDFSSLIKRKQAVYTFFDIATGEKVDRRFSDWNFILHQAHERMRVIRSREVQNAANHLNEAVTTLVNKQMNDIVLWYVSISSITYDEFQVSPKQLILSWENLQNCNISLVNDLSDLCTGLVSWFKTMGYTNYGDFEKPILTKQAFFEDLDNIMGFRIQRNSTIWKDAVRYTQEKMQDIRKNSAKKLTNELNNAVTTLIEEEMTRVLQWHHLICNDSYDNFVAFPSKTLLTWRRVNNLQFTIPWSLSNISTDLISWFQSMGYDNYGKLQKQMEKTLVLFNELEKVPGVQIEQQIIHWKDVIEKTQYKMKEDRNSRAQYFATQTNLAIVRDVSNITKIYLNKIEDDMKPLNITRSLTITQNANERLESINQSPYVNVFGSAVEVAVQKVSQNLRLEFSSKCVRNEEILRGLETLGRHILSRTENDWMKPVEQTKQKISDLITWYNFCINVERQLSSYEFQRNKPSSFNKYYWERFLRNDANLYVSSEVEAIGEQFRITGNLHFKKLEDIVNEALVEQSVQCYHKHTIVVTGRFVRLAKLLDADGSIRWDYLALCDFYVKYLEIYATETLYLDEDLKAVGNNLIVTFVAPSWEVVGRRSINLNGVNGRTNLKAPNGRVTTYEDDNQFPRFRILFVNERLRQKPSEYAGLIKEGTEVIFTWDIPRVLVYDVQEDPYSIPTYNQPTGLEDWKRKFAAHLKTLRRGSDGWPGEPGGPAGSFFGVANEIKNANALTITTVGGKGGDGADGGDGGRGTDRSATHVYDFKWYHIVVIKGSNEGTYGRNGDDGGDGGDGGIAGPGGFGGTITIQSKDGTQVGKRFGDGSAGNEGRGGEGGLGGTGENGIYCHKNRFLYIQVSKSCFDSLGYNGKQGARGKDGTVFYSPFFQQQEIKIPRKAMEVNYARSRYNEIYSSAGTNSFF